MLRKVSICSDKLKVSGDPPAEEGQSPKRTNWHFSWEHFSLISRIAYGFYGILSIVPSQPVGDSHHFWYFFRMDRFVKTGTKQVDHLQRRSQIFRSEETDVSTWFPTEISWIFDIMASTLGPRSLYLPLLAMFSRCDPLMGYLSYSS